MRLGLRVGATVTLRDDSIVTRVDRSNFGAKIGATDPRAIQIHLRLAF